MATYLELRGLFSDTDLRNRVEVAIAVAASLIATGADDTSPPWDQAAGAHDKRVAWAAAALKHTGRERDRVLKLMLAQNSGQTVANIQSASDASVQNNVNEVVDMIASGDAA